MLSYSSESLLADNETLATCSNIKTSLSKGFLYDRFTMHCDNDDIRASDETKKGRYLVWFFPEKTFLYKTDATV